MKYRALTGFSQPDYLVVADKPLSQGGIPRKLSIDQANEFFGFDYVENIVSASDSDPSFTTEIDSPREHNARWEELRKNLEGMPQRLLAICHMNDAVGYGVFALTPIKAGTVIGIYAGVQQAVSVGSSTKNYTMAIPDSTFRVDAERAGGITRFIQHLPFDFNSLCVAIRAANKEQLLRILSAYFIEPSEREERAMDNPEMLAMAKETVIEKLRTRLDVPLLMEEIKQKDFLRTGAIRERLAVSNLRTFSTIAHGQAVMALKADRDIARGEQLGFSYGLDYWMVKKRVPAYFDRSGTVIPASEYLPSLAGICEKYRTTSEGTLPDMNAALRRAASRGEIMDVIHLLEYGADIDGQGAGTGKTALHQAVIGGHFNVAKLLMDRYADNRIRDTLGKIAADYLADESPRRLGAAVKTSRL